MLISIRSHHFEVTGPYAAGHTLSAAEAHALNGLRAENIRNAAGKKFGQRALDAQGMQRLHALVQQYDAEYQFKEPQQARPSGQQWSLESKARQIGAQRAQQAFAQSGFHPAELQTLLEVEINRLANDPAVLEEAARQIEAEKTVAAQALQELLG